MKLMLLCLLSGLIYAAPAGPFKYYAGTYEITHYQCLRNTCPELRNDIVVITATDALVGGEIEVKFRKYSEGEDEYWQLGEFFEREEWAMYSERGFYKSHKFKLTDLHDGTYQVEQDISGQGSFYAFELIMVKK